jgi:hypothetical protein
MDLQDLSRQLNIHVERLTYVSTHHNEEVCLKPNEFLVDLTRIPYEQILKPDKQYEHCAIIRDSIQDNISQHSASLQKNLNKKTDTIFMFDDIIHSEDCDHVIKTMESYFMKKDYQIEKWEESKNVNCMYVGQIKELDDMIFNIINKVVQKLHIHYDIQCNGDSGYCYRKIYGPTRIHKDGIFVEKDKQYVPMKKIRNMSIIICLNEDYEGGEFYFPNQDRTIKLKKGNIIAFPPYWTHPHMTYPLLNNTYRYTINTWLYE